MTAAQDPKPLPPLNRRGQIWTTEELLALRDEFARNLTLEEMMIAHGRTAYAIIGKLMQLGHLTMVGFGYHRIEPDPWVLTSVIRQLQKEMP